MPLIKKTLTPCDWISRMFYLFEPRLWTSVLCLLLESESKILEASRSPTADPGEKISLQCIGWKQRCEIFSWVAFQMMKFIFRRPCLNSLFDLVRQHIKWIQLCKCKLFIHVQEFEKISGDRFLAASSLFSFYWSAHIQFLVDRKLFCVAISPLTSVHHTAYIYKVAWAGHGPAALSHILVFKARVAFPLYWVFPMPHRLAKPRKLSLDCKLCISILQQRLNFFLIDTFWLQ